MVTRFTCLRSFPFEVDAEDLWRKLSRPADYTAWWPWLVAFDLEALEAGHTADCEIRAPLGYRLRFTVEVLEVVPGAAIVGRVGGDVEGPARLDVASTGTGAEATLTWDLAVRTGPGALVARLAPRLALWGHDQVIESGRRQFEAVLAHTPTPAAEA